MKDKKKIVLTVLLLIGIVGILAFKIGGNVIHNNQIANKKTYSGSLASPTLGNWEITNEWVDLSSNNNVTITGTSATINATTNYIEDNELTYRMHLTYEGGTATSNFSNAVEYQEGVVLYWPIDKFPFLTRDSDISESNYIWSEDITNKLNEKLKINQYEISEVVESRLREMLNLIKKQINLLTKKEISYIIVTGGLTENRDFRLILNKIFKNKAIVGRVSELGVRHNRYGSSVGLIKYYDEKSRLKDKEYSIYSIEEQQALGGYDLEEENDSSIVKLFRNFFG